MLKVNLIHTMRKQGMKTVKSLATTVYLSKSNFREIKSITALIRIFRSCRSLAKKETVKKEIGL